MTGASLARARAAKETLSAALHGLPELRGLGIAVLDGGYGVKVNLARAARCEIPAEVDEVPVVVEIIGAIE